jgi:ATP-dependent DNA helicase
MIIDSHRWISCSQTNQLDSLLEKASEYSNFIAQDLQELQEGMAIEAKAAANSKGDNKKKKRKGETSASNGSKKQKNSKSKAALVTAQTKDAKGGGKEIFVQPKNLAAGCILKDYQKEGVRWMASLFENGVSGILADEVSILLEEKTLCIHCHLMFPFDFSFLDGSW